MNRTKPLFYCPKCGLGFRIRKTSPTRENVVRNLRIHRKSCKGIGIRKVYDSIHKQWIDVRMNDKLRKLSKESVRVK